MPEIPYTPARARYAANHLRKWAIAEYGDQGVRDLLASSLNVPTYRPSPEGEPDMAAVMGPLLRHVTDTAEFKARTITKRSVQVSRTVLHAAAAVSDIARQKVRPS